MIKAKPVNVRNTATLSALSRKGPDERLVINLSLGWHGRFGGPDLATMPLTVRAVYDVLRYARCTGALTIAATGNSAGRKPPIPGPFYPGGWETVPAPSPAVCQNELGVSLPRVDNGALVYAATGVDTQDQFLIETPVGAVSGLAGPAAQVIVTDSDPPEKAPGIVPRTGSSMAAAVVTSAAALAWAYDPTLLPQNVVARVKKTGVDLGVDADYCLAGRPCGRVSRVSLCQLVNESCGAGLCKQPPSCAPDASRKTLAVAPSYATTLADPCTGRRAPSSCSAPSADAFRNDPRVPAVLPMPSEPICPFCELGSGTGVLDMPLNGNLDNYRFDATGLWIYDDIAPQYGWLWLDLTGTFASDQWGGTHLSGVLPLAQAGMQAPVYAAAVDFLYDEVDVFGNLVTQASTEWIWVSP